MAGGIESSVKCPECGFVSSVLLDQCDKCGHRFRLPAGGETVSANHRSPAVPEERWRKELTNRVQSFRRRRANLRGAFDTGSSLEFDFGHDGGGEADTFPGLELVQAVRPSDEFDAVLRAGKEGRENRPVLDRIPLRQEAEPVESHRPINSDPEADGLPSETRRRRRLDPGEISIVMESSSIDDSEPAAWRVPVAPIGQRFSAGIADGLLLLLALASFVAIFWWSAGGRLHFRPACLGALAFVVGSLVVTYFALFGCLASATPGQQAAGLTLRSLDGSPPTSGQAFWRAFGYLVSLSALMLGFVWALVDTEGLTWHDRMSGTFLARRGPK